MQLGTKFGQNLSLVVCGQMMGSPGPGYKTPPDPFGCVLACEGLTQKLVRCLVAGEQQALCVLQQALTGCGQDNIGMDLPQGLVISVSGILHKALPWGYQMVVGPSLQPAGAQPSRGMVAPRPRQENGCLQEPAATHNAWAWPLPEAKDHGE